MRIIMKGNWGDFAAMEVSLALALSSWRRRRS